VIAIRRLDGRVLDVVEMPPDEVDRIIRWVSGPLGDEKEVDSGVDEAGYV